MAEQQPLVSVVIPTYNDSDHLRNAIDSATCQTYSSVEIIVVDDASTDNTQSVLSEYSGDNQVQCVRHLRNRGGSAARNTGIMLAGGEYIAFLDADDEWHPRKLSIQCRYLRDNPDVGAVYCDIDYERLGIFKNIRRLLKKAFIEDGIEYQYPAGEELIPELLHIRFDTHGASTLVVRQSVVSNLDGFDHEFSRHQDWEFLIRLLQHSSLGYVDQILVNRYDTSSPGAEAVKSAKKLYFKKFDDLISEYEEEGHSIREEHKFDLARRYLLEGNYSEGFVQLGGVQLSRRRLVVAVWSSIKGLAYIS